jgi:hypothetical protein
VKFGKIICTPFYPLSSGLYITMEVPRVHLGGTNIVTFIREFLYLGEHELPVWPINIKYHCINTEEGVALCLLTFLFLALDGG